MLRLASSLHILIFGFFFFFFGLERNPPFVCIWALTGLGHSRLALPRRKLSFPKLHVSCYQDELDARSSWNRTLFSLVFESRLPGSTSHTRQASLAPYVNEG